MEILIGFIIGWLVIGVPNFIRRKKSDIWWNRLWRRMGMR